TGGRRREAVVKAGGSGPRVSQARLGANVALSLVLGNGGVGVEVGGATADLTTREVPDLGSLFGGSKLPPLPAGEWGPSSAPGGEGPDQTASGPDRAGGAGRAPFATVYPGAAG